MYKDSCRWLYKDSIIPEKKEMFIKYEFDPGRIKWSEWRSKLSSRVFKTRPRHTRITGRQPLSSVGPPLELLDWPQPSLTQAARVFESVWFQVRSWPRLAGSWGRVHLLEDKTGLLSSGKSRSELQGSTSAIVCTSKKLFYTGKLGKSRKFSGMDSWPTAPSVF